VLNHLAFWQLFFHDADKKERVYVSYNWFSSPLVVGSNGVVLKLYDDVKKNGTRIFMTHPSHAKDMSLCANASAKKLNICKMIINICKMKTL
jgi:hypothetical protein